MTILTMGVRTAEFLISAHQYNSFEKGELAADLAVGAIVEKQALTAAAIGEAGDSNTGDGTISAVVVESTGQAGAYTVTMTAATTFAVTDPAGAAVATGSTGVEFSDEITFTITAGATPFIAGDTFMIDVDVTKFVFAEWASGVVYGVLYQTGVTADERTVVARNAEVQLSAIAIPTGKTQSATISGLDARGIAVRID